MRFVTVKSVEQQDIQAVHRVREELKAHRNAKANQIRGRSRAAAPGLLGQLRAGKVPELLIHLGRFAALQVQRENRARHRLVPR